MQSHKLTLDSFVEDNFKLIAIHSSLEEYRISYFLNKGLGINLIRAAKDIDFKYKSMRALYKLYKFCDEKNMCDYFLINNKYEGSTNKTISSGSLFTTGNEVVTTYLLPQFKKVDYFLKIENHPSQQLLQDLLLQINSTPNISLAYAIEYDQLKNKENLIFE